MHDSEKLLGLRPALFFKITNFSFHRLKDSLKRLKEKGLVHNSAKLFNEILDQLIDLIDQYWCPIIVNEIVIQKKGNTKLTYKSFFIDETDNWQESALKIKNKYSLQVKIIEILATNLYNYLCDFINILLLDIDDLKNHLNNQLEVKHIDFSASDIHDGGKCTIILEFTNQKKLVFKPKSYANDDFIIDYLSLAGLDKDHFFIPRLIFKRKNYFWTEHVNHIQYENDEDLKTFYYHAGVVLAVMDSLNFSDGHHENFISAPDKKLYLIDTETILVNLSYFTDNNLDSFYDLTFTGMVENKDTMVDEEFSSALQSTSELFNYPFEASIENDLTTDISIKYNTLKLNLYSKNKPAKNANIANFKQEVLQGMQEAYSKIKKIDRKALGDLIEKYADTLELRQIKRPTIYYAWLLCRICHPLNDKFEDFVQENMMNYPKEIVDYELHYLKKGEIPIFFHNLRSKSLLGLKNETIVSDYFSNTGLKWFTKKLDDLKRDNFLNKRYSEINSIL